MSKSVRQILAMFPEGTPQCYEELYRILEYDPGTTAKVEAAAARVSGPMWKLYERLELYSGVPAVMTGLIHALECNNDIHGCLHNGQRIVGTSKKTTIVPIGRGPFNRFSSLEDNWIDAAMDARFTQSRWEVPKWTVGYILRQCERFNGTGYINGKGKSELSPYVWACTNINDGLGKYTSDGKFNPAAPANGQVGVAAIMRELERMGLYEPQYSFRTSS